MGEKDIPITAFFFLFTVIPFIFLYLWKNMALSFQITKRKKIKGRKGKELNSTWPILLPISNDMLKYHKN